VLNIANICYLRSLQLVKSIIILLNFEAEAKTYTGSVILIFYIFKSAGKAGTGKMRTGKKI